MNLLAATPTPPYYAVIFTSQRSAIDEGYNRMAQRMVELAAQQPGFLGVESARNASGLGITVSYWENMEAIARWKAQSEHRQAQQLGRDIWYERYRVRICKVEREHGFEVSG